MDFKKATRDRIQSNAHGKFDLLDKIFPKDTLLSEKLWVLRLMIAEILEMEVDKISASALSMWRKRYKEKNNHQPHPSSENDWRSFKPTDPDTLKEQDINKLIVPVTKNNDT
jgi:hypothetical protein